MEHAELFLLLPVYEEATDQSAYVKRIGILEEEEYEKLMTKLREVSLYFCYENYECYYDSMNLNAFMIPIESLIDCYPKASTLFRRRKIIGEVIGEGVNRLLTKISASF